MPLYVVNEKIDKLRVDAIALPYCDSEKNYYETNFCDSKSLYEIYQMLVDYEYASNLKSKSEKIYIKNKPYTKIGIRLFLHILILIIFIDCDICKHLS